MFVIKLFWGDNLEVTCTFLTTCTVNKITESSTKEINTLEGMKVSHLALESKADSNELLCILLLLSLKDSMSKCI